MPARKNPAEKKLIWSWVGGNLVVLIPKKRGNGYLKTPYWHKIDPALEDIRHQLGDVDIFGLDGHLEFVLSYSSRAGSTPDSFAEKAIPLLVAHYGWPAEESHAEFLRLHPCPTWDGHTDK